jgi:hypothetical protein
VLNEIKGENVRLISIPSWAQRPKLGLDLAPWSGAPNPNGWWAPVTLRYIKRWGPAALFTSWQLPVSPPTNPSRSWGCAASDGKSPPPSPPLHHTTSTSAPPFSIDRRCPRAEEGDVRVQRCRSCQDFGHRRYWHWIQWFANLDHSLFIDSSRSCT